MDERQAVEVRVTGRVQGVGFRAWTEDEAQALGLDGWVRNMPDGSVEALFVGRRGAVQQMLAACRQGPRPARVDSVESREIVPAPDIAGFGTRR